MKRGVREKIGWCICVPFSWVLWSVRSQNDKNASSDIFSLKLQWGAFRRPTQRHWSMTARRKQKLFFCSTSATTPTQPAMTDALACAPLIPPKPLVTKTLPLRSSASRYRRPVVCKKRHTCRQTVQTRWVEKNYTFHSNKSASYMYFWCMNTTKLEHVQQMEL